MVGGTEDEDSWPYVSPTYASHLHAKPTLFKWVDLLQKHMTAVVVTSVDKN